MLRSYRGSAILSSLQPIMPCLYAVCCKITSLSLTARVSGWTLNWIWNFLKPCLQACRFPLKRCKDSPPFKQNVSGSVTLLPVTKIRPASFNKRQQNEEAFSQKLSWRGHVSPVFPSFRYGKHCFQCQRFCFQDANYAHATRQGILTKIRACEHLQKFCEYEQASTRVIFVSNSGKGQILRALSNWMGPFDTPHCDDAYRSP